MAQEKSPFDIPEKTYVHFPNDQYVDACVLSYQIADLPPVPLATSNDPGPSARFLMGGFVPDENGGFVKNDDGSLVLARKWTNWLRISNSPRSKLMQLFQEFINLFDILKDCERADGKLWTTPMKILLEQSSNQKYQNIIRIKPGKNTDLVQSAFYDEKYVPYKVVKAYGRPQPLRLAWCKNASGVKCYDQTTMADAPQE